MDCKIGGLGNIFKSQTYSF